MISIQHDGVVDGDDQHSDSDGEVDGEDDQHNGEVDGEDQHDDVDVAPVRCRGPCTWVTGYQLPPTFAKETIEN